MKIEVQQEKISKALNIVSRTAVGTRATLPVLNNVLIRVDNKKVSLVSTNLDMAVVDYLPVSKSEDGVITVPAKLLAEFVANLPKGNVVIESNDTKVTVTLGKYSSTMNGTVADEFPEIPEINEKAAVSFKMGVDEFKTSINQVMIASSNDLTRPALTGVYFNTTAEGELAVAATDGYRLAEKIMVDKVESEVAAIVPTSSLQEVMRSISDEMDEVEISFSEDLVRFRLGEVEIISKLIDGSFPDYRKLIPKDNNIEVVLPKSELVRVTKLAALFAREVGGSITCATRDPGVFSVKSVANEFGENDSEIEAKVDVIGKVNLNSRFLLDALNALDEDKIVFKFSDKIAPVLLQNAKSKKYTHIVMPLNS